jgi:hypothetical protein
VVASLVTDSDLKQEVLRLIEERNRQDSEKEFTAWCDDLVALPEDFELKLKGDLNAGIELQPLRWMDSGIDLIESSKVTARVQLPGGVEGRPLQSYLPYPVFQMGTEIFLKGMWLCQHEDCRLLADDSYIEPAKRQEYHRQLGSQGLGHDLIGIIDAIRSISQYRHDPPTMRFLKIVEGVVRRFYFPLYAADRRELRWAHSRYPKRFYDDRAQKGFADSFQRYPQQLMIARIFRESAGRIDNVWKLRAELSARTSRQGKSNHVG